MIEEDLRDRVADDAAISEKVKKAAVAWGDRPQAGGFPAITLDFINDQRAQHMAGFQGLRSTQVQADVWSKDKVEARDIRELLIAAVVPAGVAGSTRFRRSFVDRLSSSFERVENATIYRERIDFTVWHGAA